MGPITVSPPRTHRFAAPARRPMIAFAAGCFLAGALSAQQPPEASGDMSLEQLLNVKVSSAAKIEQNPREAPSVINLISREQIEAYGWNSIDEVLGRQPGFGASQDYDRHTVSSRGVFEGWNNNHLLLLVDGLPFNDNLYGTAYTWEITPLYWTRSLEITRGPGSALYGSNAANGVIQINTVRADEVVKGGEGRMQTGDDGVRNYDLLLGQTGSRVSVVAGLSFGETEGNRQLSYDGSGRMDASGVLQRFTTWDHRSHYYGFAKLDGEGGLAGWRLQYHEQYWDYETGHGWLWWIPDFKEAMAERRRILSLSYKPEPKGRLSQEYSLRYQWHGIDWNQRYYPNDAFGGYYPAGMWEYLNTSAADYFARAQLGWSLPKTGSLLGGVEIDRFLYNGDRAHFSNVNVDDPYYSPFPNNASEPLGPWLDFILNEPLTYTGVFGQWSSGDELGKTLKLTAGLRYDRLAFNYRKIHDPGQPEAAKRFSQVSPRLALVWLPSDAWSLKLMWGKAFRAPTPTEMAGAHTFSLASNIEQLRPEEIRTLEAAVEWKINANLRWSANIFRTAFQNQIAYSAQNFNLSTNILSTTTAGLETELLWGWHNLSGFLNYAYVRRLDETLQDQTLALEKDHLTWAPAHKVNFGANGKWGRFSAGLSGHYQSQVDRRASDTGLQTLPFGVGVTLDMDQYRGHAVDPWLTLDAKLGWRAADAFKLELIANNIFDKNYALVKVGGFPFDYRQEGRRWRVSGSYRF